MYDTSVTWRSNFIRFLEEKVSGIISYNTFYFVDDKTGTKNYIGSDSGDTRITRERALESFN
jgi:hypothetical protein